MEPFCKSAEDIVIGFKSIVGLGASAGNSEFCFLNSVFSPGARKTENRRQESEFLTNSHFGSRSGSQLEGKMEPFCKSAEEIVIGFKSIVGVGAWAGNSEFCFLNSVFSLGARKTENRRQESEFLTDYFRTLARGAEASLRANQDCWLRRGTGKFCF
jgi:hypothetical protein